MSITLVFPTLHLFPGVDTPWVQYFALDQKILLKYGVSLLWDSTVHPGFEPCVELE